VANQNQLIFHVKVVSSDVISFLLVLVHTVLVQIKSTEGSGAARKPSSDFAELIDVIVTALPIRSWNE